MKNLILTALILSALAGCAKREYPRVNADIPHNRIIASNGVRDIYARDVVAEIIVKDNLRRELEAE